LPINPKYKRIIEIASLLVIAAAMALGISIGLNIYLAGSTNPQVAVTTGSMLPIYNGFQNDDYSPIIPFRGDILLIRKVSPENISVGDVIVFHRSNNTNDIPVVHRVIDKWEFKGEYVYKTNGDNNVVPDSWIVYESNIRGVVVFRIPHIGWFLILIQSTAGRIIILALAIIILFSGDDTNTENSSKNNIKINKNDLSSFPRINLRILFQRKYIYIITVGIILISFLGSNIISALSSKSSVGLYNINDTSRSNNLLYSTYLNPTTLTIKYSWTQWDNTSVYFFPIQIKVTSNGFLNNIHYFHVKIQNVPGHYQWTIVYDYIGTKVFEGGIIGYFNTTGSQQVLVSLTIKSRGILGSPIQFFSFPLILSI